MPGTALFCPQKAHVMPCTVLLLPGRRRSVACPAICRGPAAKPVHAVCQTSSSRLILLPLRGRSRASLLPRPPARIKSRDTFSAAPGPHPDDLPGTGSKTVARGVSGITGPPDFATAARQIVRMRPRHKPRSYRIRPETATSAIRLSYFASATFSFGGVHPPPSALYRSI